MNYRIRLIFVVAVFAAFVGTGNLIFVLNRLPDIHWSSLFAGIAGVVVAALLAVILRKEKKRASNGSTNP